MQGYVSVVSGHNSWSIFLSGTDSYYYFRSVSSGKNASIICNNGDKCYIICHGNSCNGLNVSCVGNCTLNINRNSAFESDVCPDGLVVPVDDHDLDVTIQVDNYLNS